MEDQAPDAPRAMPRQSPRGRSRRITSDSLHDARGRKRYRSLRIDESAIVLKHLPAGYTEAQLVELCQPFGQIKSVKILRNQETNEEMHKAVVKFVSALSAHAALEDLNGKLVDGSQLHVSKPDVDNVKERASLKILVKKIPLELDEASVRKVFQRYGDIASLVVLDKESEDSWMCTIKYNSFEAATAAKAGMNKKTLTPETGAISVKFTRAKVVGEEVRPEDNPANRRRSMRVHKSRLSDLM